MVINKLKDKILENINNVDDSKREIPTQLRIIPLRDNIIFPRTISPIKIEKKHSIEAIEEVMKTSKIIGVTGLKEGKDELSIDNLYHVGTAVLIHKILKIPNQGVVLIVQGLEKIAFLEMQEIEGKYSAQAEVIEEDSDLGKEVEALMKNALSRLQQLIAHVPYLPEELQIAASQIKDPLKLSYLIASLIRMKVGEKQTILELSTATKKLQQAVSIMDREIDLLELGNKIQSDVKIEMDRSKKEFFLRQQLKAIQKELGNNDDLDVEEDALQEKINSANLPKHVKKVAEKELKRMRRMPPAASEYHVIRTYLDWIVELPWNSASVDNLDIDKARKVLDTDHFSLDKVKDRIIEYLAVRSLKKDDMKGPILCFVGPPGVGKTSLGKSIAKALGRKFIRQSLGGMHDEAEIRGHRRTYIGAMPGKIIQALKAAGTKNPVIMLDEIDKIGRDFQGDPSSALLEVLDPEQNKTFTDHYMGLEFDLSQVIFIATANTLETLQTALLDRMEVLHLSGYAMEEKVEIAKKYLIKKQIKANGIRVKDISFQKKGIEKIIQNYTRESGVRNLERQIATICRKVATEHVKDNQKEKVVISPEFVRKYLGIEKVENEVASRVSRAGVVTGLAWTAAGGDILFVEANVMPGGKGLTLTGQLGDVMKESAQAAMSVIRSRAKKLGIPVNFREKNDIHLHVPQGAIPKDGPSAGITMATAIASALLNKKVRKDVAMTGEITLTGQVLPIGGLKEKSLAAKRAGIKEIIIPKKNEKDLEELDMDLLKGLKISFAESISDVFEIAFA